MDSHICLEKLKEYIERTKEILELSSPLVTGINNSEEYRLHLQSSFQKIGELSRENNQILNEYFFPMVEKDRIPTEEEVAIMREFSSLLVDPTNMENFDLHLIYLQAKTILKAAEKSGDLRSLILALDNMVISTYTMVNLTIRLYPYLDVCYKYRDEGIKAALKILDYLEPEKFASLPDDECRELVLINSRYIRSLFEWDDKKDRAKHNKEDLRLMKQALAIAEDPFYREMMPNYRWDVHIFRTLQYISDFTEHNNSHGFTRDELEEILGYTKKLIEFLNEHPELEEGCPESEQQFYLARNRYLVGELSPEAYRKTLVGIMKSRDSDDFTARSMFINFIVPLEYILSLEGQKMSAQDEDVLRKIYEVLARYAYHMPKTGVFTFMITFLTEILQHYVEVPGGISFRDMCLKLMAAMHPPTYVHSLNVADISWRITHHLIEKQPELFIGVADAVDADDVVVRRKDILDFVYESALLHDVGKLYIAETILTYGRSLIKPEFEIVRAHPAVGASMLSLYDSTKDYVEVANGHQRWLDDSSGYPKSFKNSKAEHPTVVAIVEVADCLDAATDSIGRSYKRGATLDEFVEELRETRGTRYAPYVVDLFEDPSVRNEFNAGLTHLRNMNYREAYNTLKEL